jgi:hypothetical protein
MLIKLVLDLPTDLFNSTILLKPKNATEKSLYFNKQGLSVIGMQLKN